MENQEMETKEVMESQPKKHGKGIADAIKALSQRIIGVFKDYPVTMIMIMIAALASAILVGIDYKTYHEPFQKVITFCLITATGALFFEEFFPKNKIFRIIGYAASAITAIPYVAIFYSKAETILGMNADIVQETAAKLLGVEGTILVGLAIWHMFRRLEDDFEVYATKAFLELIKSSVIYGLFAAGLAIIVLIFDALICKTGDLLSQVEIFLASGIYVPMCLKAISSKNEEPGKFFRVCIQYVLLPMLLVAFVIIYLYILKVFITRDIPSNKIFYILAGLFSIGMPIWTCVHGMEQKEGFLNKAAKFLPFVFLPFVLLQIWSLGLRIGQYGYTASRYFGVVMIVCEIIYFVFYLIQLRGERQAISWTIFALMVATLLSLFGPLSYDRVTINSQMKRLTSMLSMANIEKEDEKSIKRTYRALKNLGYKGKSALENGLSEAQKEQIESYDEYGTLTSERITLSDYPGSNEIDVAGYNRLIRLETTSHPSAKFADGKLPMHTSGNTEVTQALTVDFSELIAYATTFTRDNDATFKLGSRAKFVISEDKAIWISSFRISFDKKTKEVKELRVSGYLMTK